MINDHVPIRSIKFEIYDHFLWTRARSLLRLLPFRSFQILNKIIRVKILDIISYLRSLVVRSHREDRKRDLQDLKELCDRRKLNCWKHLHDRNRPNDQKASRSWRALWLSRASWSLGPSRSLRFVRSRSESKPLFDFNRLEL